MQYVSYFNTPLGRIMLASDGYALIGLWFEGQKHFAHCLDKEYEEKELPVFEKTKAYRVCMRS